MLSSRNIDDLRADVAAAVREGLARCKAAGLNVLVTNTVRDDEYQAYLYGQGRTRPGNIVTNAKVPSFHSVKAGLAFDFCENIKGHEYDRPKFFTAVSDIFKAMHFEWGGDWKSISDTPHLQWSGYNHEFTSADIIAGRYPPVLVIDGATPEPEPEPQPAQQDNTPDGYAQAAVEKALRKGILLGDDTGDLKLHSPITRQDVLVILDRAGALSE